MLNISLWIHDVIFMNEVRSIHTNLVINFLMIDSSNSHLITDTDFGLNGTYIIQLKINYNSYSNQCLNDGFSHHHAIGIDSGLNNNKF